MGRFDGRKSSRRKAKTAVMVIDPIAPLLQGEGADSRRFQQNIVGMLALSVAAHVQGLSKAVYGIAGLTNMETAKKIVDRAMQGDDAAVDHTTDAPAPKDRAAHRQVARGGRRTAGKKKVISEAGKQAIRLAQLKRWRKIKREQSKPGTIGRARVIKSARKTKGMNPLNRAPQPRKRRVRVNAE